MNLTWDKTWRLIASLVIDLVGMGSMSLGLTEIVDVVYAPMSAAMILAMYGNVWFAALGAAEEALPFTDIIPTATLAWLFTYKPWEK